MKALLLRLFWPERFISEILPQCTFTYHSGGFDPDRIEVWCNDKRVYWYYWIDGLEEAKRPRQTVLGAVHKAWEASTYPPVKPWIEKFVNPPRVL